MDLLQTTINQIGPLDDQQLLLRAVARTHLRSPQVHSDGWRSCRFGLPVSPDANGHG